MLIRETFATSIQERIEPVVKVAERRPAVLLNELSNLVVTPQWESHLRRILDVYTNAADSEDEQSIGVWISGFFGSGKSLLMKVLGVLLHGGELEGRAVHEVFLNRVASNSPERTALQRYLAICQRKIETTYVGGNLHAMQTAHNDSLALIAFKLFAVQQGYTQNWPLAWAVEYHLDTRGLTEQFRQTATELCSMDWEEIALDPEFYLEQLYEAAVRVMPDHFKGGVGAVERAVTTVLQSGIDTKMLVERLCRWCEAQEGGPNPKRHKLLLQLDELGQWLTGGNANARTMEVQILSEAAATYGKGRIWLAVTAHGDVQALKNNVQQEYYAKIIQRFGVPCKLTNEDISMVVEQRLLMKTQEARHYLQALFQQRSGELADLGTLKEPKRVYPAPDNASFPLFYPFLPWTLTIIPDVVKGIAQAAGRDEALTGANRTMIGVVQGSIIETPGLLQTQVGKLLSLADLYDQVASDAPIETKTDLNQIKSKVPGATDFTVRVARALYLLGQVEYIPNLLENITRSLADSLDVNLAGLRKQAKDELERLVEAGYAKQVGEQYIFLTTQQRGFQDRVRARKEELLLQTYELSQALKDYDGEDALRFERVALSGRELPLKLEIDGRSIRNPGAAVAIKVYSPFQQALDPGIGDDNTLKQRSAQDPDNILFRLGNIEGLRETLALAVATEKVADQLITSGPSNGTEQEIARKARQDDLQEHKRQVRQMLARAVKGGLLFFRGSIYQLAEGENPAGAVRSTLAQLLPAIFSRYSDLPYRVSNEETAVKAALNGNTTNPDLQGLGVYKADGTLNESNALISTLRGHLPVDDQYSSPVSADTLRNSFERPPYGWDGNAIRIGLALLLRNSGCRLIENNKTITDPKDPEAVAVLTREARFKTLKVQGIKSELGITELQQIRGYLEMIYQIKPALVPATLNNALGDELTETANKARGLATWATNVQCPLPQSVASGRAIIDELLNNANPVARLPRFLEQADTLLKVSELLGEIEEFQRAHGTEFQQMHTFYNQMVNTDLSLDKLRQFIKDYRTIEQERSFTTPARWNELAPVYRAALQAFTNQLIEWRQEVRDELSKTEAGFESLAQNAGVPAESLPTEVKNMRRLFEDTQARLETNNLTYYETRGLKSALTEAQLKLNRKVADLRQIYRPAPPVSEVIRLKWSEVAGTVQVESPQDIEATLAKLRSALEAQLARHNRVIIE
jgi:hypothetical protein